MISSRRRVKEHRRLRFALAGTGALAIVAAVGADLVRGGSLGDFGAAQFALATLGATAIVGAVTWRRFAGIYRDTATILLTVVLLLVGLNLVARLLLRPPDESNTHDPADLQYFTDQDWGREVWSDLEVILARRAYEPYTLWRAVPYKSALTNVSDSGYRLTPGSDCSAGAYRIFLFGGSTVWGYAVPDSGTIPAYLQARLSAEWPDRRICVVNLGQLGYVSTQSRIAFLRRLQQDDRPDLAVFYEGYNDLFAARYYRVGAHFHQDEIERRIEGTPAGMAADWFREFGLLRLANQWRVTRQRDTPTAPRSALGDSLAVAAAEHYLTNARIIDAVAERLGVPVLFFWQPIITVGNKPLTDEERRIAAFTSADVAEFERNAAGHVASASTNIRNLHFLGTIFDTVDSFVLIDQVHLTRSGNRLIADAMAGTILQEWLRAPSTLR